jgi:hypothetical protein
LLSLYKNKKKKNLNDNIMINFLLLLLKEGFILNLPLTLSYLPNAPTLSSFYNNNLTYKKELENKGIKNLN